METLANRRRQLMTTKFFRGKRKKCDSFNSSLIPIPIKMGSQSFKSRQGGSVCSSVVQRNKIQTSPCLMTHNGGSEKQKINIPSQTNFICDDLRRISKSLDCLKNDVMLQHREILRDVESKISSVNNGIISDIDQIRENLHSLENIVQNRNVDCDLNSALSDGELGEFTVKSVENLVSRTPFSPFSFISSPDSIGNVFSPGAKSQDSGIFFDEHRSSSFGSSFKSSLRKDGFPDDNWRISSGSNYTDVFDRFSLSEEPCFKISTPFKEEYQQQCHGYQSGENVGSFGHRSVIKTRDEDADVDDSRTPDAAVIEDFRTDKHGSATNLEIEESFIDKNSVVDQKTVLDKNNVDIERTFDNCSVEKYSSTKYLECLVPKDNTCRQRYAEGVLNDAKPDNGDCDVLNKSYEFESFPEATLFDWRWKISQSLSTRCFCKEQFTFDEEFQQIIDANQNFREDMVRSHNAFRIYHGCQDLVEADDLTRDAQMWADIIAEKSFLQYSELPGRGESVAFLDTNGQSLNAADVTKIWYEQKNNYDYNTPKWRKDSMNFTQLVWKSTSDIGIGIAKVKGQDRCVVVAQYRPAGNGNMPGEFRKNVLPPQ